MMSQTQIASIQEYYGRVLASKNDLKTTACCSIVTPPAHLREILAAIHPEVHAKFYGCGIPVPVGLAGARVLDLGSGSGRDCFVLSKLVGEKGTVIGVDMTDEQLEVARRHGAFHAKAFGFARENVDFRKGFIEDLAAADIADASVDVVVSNCVINLSPAKDKVFSEIARVLKPGGELYFSDVFSDRRLPLALRDDPVVLGECLGGAMYTEDFRRLMATVGMTDVRVMAKTPIEVTSPEVASRTGNAKFSSLTLRAFKLPLEDRCEDYGQFAVYKGTLSECPHAFTLDDHHTFFAGKPMAVCSNTAAMLSQTRFASHFTVHGNTETHYGLFDCAPVATSLAAAGTAAPGGCC
jgi:SAM-dependent methyltransferase